MTSKFDSLKQSIPMTTRITTRRRIQDIGPTLGFALNPRKQQRAQDELTNCRNLNDYLEFASRWLGAGAIQMVPEIRATLDYISAQKPIRACEIGTDFGGTTFLLSRTLPSLKLLIGIDLYIKNRSQLAALAPRQLRLELLNGSSYAPTMVERVEQILKGDKLDVLLIDGDHSYEGVLKDFLGYRSLVREQGIILFHDIVPDYQTRYGRPTGAYSGGVPDLWAQLSKLYPSREFINDPNQDGLGLGALTYSSNVSLPSDLTNPAR